jgi:pimeloyl-ACP methyl ester carboxylesterase
MHVHKWGSSADVALIFWHALGPSSSGAELGEIAPAIADAGFQVLAVDGPGFGRSPAVLPDGYRLTALAALLRSLIEERALDRPVLMGHSWGGAVAVRYAGANPEDVRALVLLDSGHIDAGDLEDVDATRPLEAWVEDTRARWQTFGDDVAVTTPPEVNGAAMFGLLEPISDAWPALAEHQIPTLLYLATEPPHVHENRKHIARFETAVPHADVRWPDGASHGLLADLGPPLGEEIATWLVEQGL